MGKYDRSSKYNILSRLFFCWVDPLLFVGCRRSLTDDDLANCPGEINSKRLLSLFNRYWQFECSIRSDNPRLWLVVVKCLWWRMLLQIVLVLAVIVLLLVNSELVGRLSEYYIISDPTSQETNIAYYIAAGLSVVTFAIAMLNLVFYAGEKIGGMMRILLTSVIYQKILSLSQVTLNKLSIGHVVNLASNDVHRYDEALLFYPFIFASPIHFAAVFYFLYTEIGLATLAPFIVLFLFSVMQFILSFLFVKIRSRAAVKTDKRIKTMNEVISGIRVIKMYAWEYAFSDLVKRIRRSEMWTIFISFIIRGILLVFTIVQIPLCMFLAFSTFSLMGGSLNPRIVFSTLLHMSYMRYTLSHFLLALLQISEGIVGYKRIKRFLLSNELETTTWKVTTDGENEKCVDKHLKVDSLSLSWTQSRDNPQVKRLSFKLEKTNPLMAVVGRIGSGKSTLFQCLLNELPPVEGHVAISGSVAYASQEPWIFSGTVKENVLFGANYNADWYDRVVEACALDTDLLSLQYGDQTLVGERGVTLSGGQKARLSLARAVYRNADVYFLDDPLSAVDAAVGRHIFDRCIKGLLSNKCIILVTHQLQYLDQCDCILALNKDHGYGSFYSCYSEFCEATDIKCYIGTEHDMDETKEETTNNDHTTVVSTNSNSADGEEPRKSTEERAHGTITYKTYIDYFRAGGSFVLVGIVLCLIFMVEANTVLCDWWIADWSDCSVRSNDSTSSRCNISDIHRIAISGGLTLSLVVFSIARMIIFTGMLLRASYTLHKRMFKKVLRAPVLFFDTNPVGRVLNRFSKDVGFMDDLLIWQFLLFQNLTTRCLTILIVAAVANPFLVPPLIFILILLLVLRWYYIKTARDVKRLEAIARSPVYSHISHTLRGLATIRSYSMEDDAMEQFHIFQNKHSQAWYPSITVKRWFAMRIDFLMFGFISLTVLTSVAVSTNSIIDAAILGLSVAYVFFLTDVFSFCVRVSTEVESNMVSVERLLAYGRLESEAELETDSVAVALPSDWPSKGSIEMRNVCYSHSPSTPDVLRNINCSIYPKEKVGIIGRTGAGKSSFVAALLRIAEPKGVIEIDGIDISTLGLHDVRGNISVIPQDPVLFVGAVRYNLDPCRRKSDIQLWRALEQVQLDTVVHSLEGELDAILSEGGGNFSVGQRQLICLARALLQNNMIIIMDEATANIDLETDMLIQDVIRQQFSERTVLTIAHRLDTVMDSDKIMVLQNGEIIEYGCPFDLLQDPQSTLMWFVNQTGTASGERLMEVAREAYERQSRSTIISHN